MTITILERTFEINEIIEIKKYINDKNIEKLIENIDVLEYFLIKYSHLLDKNDITKLMREIKKTKESLFLKSNIKH